MLRVYKIQNCVLSIIIFPFLDRRKYAILMRRPGSRESRMEVYVDNEVQMLAKRFVCKAWEFDNLNKQLNFN
jgi:hypothetical protein